MKRKLLFFICITAIFCGLTACSSTKTTQKDSAETTQTDSTQTAQTDSTQTASVIANENLIGKIISIDDSTITLLLGELTDSVSNVQNPQPKNEDAPSAASSEVNTKEQPPEASNKDMPNGQMSEAPNGNAPNGNIPNENTPNGQPPETPNGDAPNENTPNGQPPETPNGDAPNENTPNGQPPEAPNGEQPFDGTAEENAQSRFLSGTETITLTVTDEIQGTLTNLKTEDIVRIQTDEDGKLISIEKINMDTSFEQSGGSIGFGGSKEVTQGTAATIIDTNGSYNNQTYTSTGDDENALRIDGASVTLDNITVDKSAGATSNTENGDFYGMNAALLATNGADVTIKNSTVTSSAQNGNGIFSYGTGTSVTVSDSTITTTSDNSGGIQTTGGGTMNASNLTVTTSGSSSAAIRSDRGGGTVNVDGGSYTSNGYNSPAVYSTAAITVKNATLTATNSEALVIEGQNSIVLENCLVSGNMSDTKGTSSDENVHNVMIYQSMSGDAEVGTSTFSMTGGTLTSHNGDLFYITNTHCILTLSGVEIINRESDGYLLLASGNSAGHGWGTAGANGAQVEFTANGQTLEGDIAVDTISTLTMTLTGNSIFNGTVNIIENAENGAAVDNNASVTIDAGSVWNLTGNCTLTDLKNNGTICFNGYTITLSDGTVLNS